MSLPSSSRVQTHIIQMAYSLYYCAPLLAWYLQGKGILPAFYDIGFVLLFSLLLFVFSILKYGYLEVGGLNYYLPIVFYFLFVSVMAAVFRDFTMILYVAVFLLFLVLMKLSSPSVNFDHTFLLYVGSLLTLYFLSIDFGSIGVGRVAMGEVEGAFGIIAYCAIFGMAVLASLSFKRSSQLVFIGEVVFFGVCFYTVILTGVRSPLFGFAVLTSIWLANRWATFLKPTNVVALLIILPFGFSLVDGASDRIFHIYEAVASGIETIFSNKSELMYDASASGRVLQRSYALELLYSNFLFGGGYKIFWVDFPLLQAFSDMGIFFGLFYVFVVLIVPLMFSKVLISSDGYSRLVMIFYLACIPRLFLHGQPYDWQHLIYIVPVYALIPVAFYSKGLRRFDGKDIEGKLDGF